MNNTITISELQNAVNSIESDIFESTDEIEYFNITVTTNGYTDIVNFFGIQIWNSDDDCRGYSDPEDESTIEPIEQHLRNRVNEELSKIARIKV